MKMLRSKTNHHQADDGEVVSEEWTHEKTVKSISIAFDRILNKKHGLIILKNGAIVKVEPKSAVLLAAYREAIPELFESYDRLVININEEDTK